ncbi:MAG: DUF368 domain-containing protein [Candidatus Omnitrophica bacterium]|nr:DUF368 domain-containing protein [Candidatus Omnitrophota bacterium]
MKNTNFYQNGSIFLKGLLMGICDVIPGISGGTIAFITGIYTRLITAIKNFSPQLAKSVFKYFANPNRENNQSLKENIANLDLSFLIVLGIGIFSAIAAGVRVLSFLLDKYLVYTISFFIGLILTSSKIIYDHIETHRMQDVFFGFLGILLGISLSLAIPLKITPTYAYVFLGGFLAVSAMFLPGISGAFILLIMGLYEFIIGIVRDLPSGFTYFLIFLAGALLGAFTISRFITFLFQKDKNKTLYVLLGLVVGSLNTPVRKIIQSEEYFTVLRIVLIVAMFALGIISVWFINRVKQERRSVSGSEKLP